MTRLMSTGQHLFLDIIARHITTSTRASGRAAMESTSLCTKRTTTHQGRCSSLHITNITLIEHKSERLYSPTRIISYCRRITITFPTSPNKSSLNGTTRLSLRILSRRSPNHNTTSSNTPTSSETSPQHHRHGDHIRNPLPLSPLLHPRLHCHTHISDRPLNLLPLLRRLLRLRQLLPRPSLHLSPSRHRPDATGADNASRRRETFEGEGERE